MEDSDDDKCRSTVVVHVVACGNNPEGVLRCMKKYGHDGDHRCGGISAGWILKWGETGNRILCSKK